MIIMAFIFSIGLVLFAASFVSMQHEQHIRDRAKNIDRQMSAFADRF